ncbi:MAG: anhydro-N-acetylmuramic acid kinase [Balneolaceae bacterium]
MNQWIRKLADSGHKDARMVVGLMSGTSLDGLDVALCRVHGSSIATDVELLRFATVPFSSPVEERLRSSAFRPDLTLQEALTLESRLSGEWARIVLQTLQEWDIFRGDVDLISSHGQTLLHLPDPENGHHATCQIVDGDHLATATGIPVASDFRQKLIALGGEGAPLAPLAEVLLFGSVAEKRVLLNLGGIANMTFLPAGERGGGPKPESTLRKRPGAKPVKVPFSSDCGPANTLMDEAVRREHPERRYDEGGTLAAAGRPDHELVKKLMSLPFFQRPFPKSTGQEEFSLDRLNEATEGELNRMDLPDLLATLCELSAISVAEAVSYAEAGRASLYASGGGVKNRSLMERISTHLPEMEIRKIGELGVPFDAKEAVLFAVLGNELISGAGWVFGSGERFTVGKLSFPASDP